MGERTQAILGGLSRSSGRTRRWTPVLVTAGNSESGEDDDSRLICPWGSPFGKPARSAAEIGDRIACLVRENYGHLGPMLVSRLLKVPTSWGLWKHQHDEARMDFLSRASSRGPAASKTAVHLATILSTARILHALFPEFQWAYEPTLRDLWEWLDLSGRSQTRAQAAAQAVWDWAFAHQESIHGLRAEEGAPCTGWAGRMDEEGRVWLTQGTVNKILTGQGLRPMEVLRELQAGGIVVVTSGRPWRMNYIGKLAMRCIGFRPIGSKK